jgi:Protein of unknown function (DUF1194)
MEAVYVAGRADGKGDAAPLLSAAAHVTIGESAKEQEGHMWARTSIAVLAAGVAILVLAGWTGGFAPHAPLFADNRPGSVVVDAELVIAVDVSNSMDPEEQALQREG